MENSEKFIMQFGVKGMRWGVRKRERSVSPDHATARTLQKKHPSELSNQELQALVTRMNLEKQFNAAKPPSAGSKAGKFLAEILVNVGKQQVTKLANDALSKEVARMMAGAKK